ncbi:MAG: inorganic phosphate transporter [Proteobacteria bacterium]|nr:inorganic phosphate transporter [Pseudomonadota bacterium]
MSEHALAKKVPVPIDLKKIFRLETAPAGNGGGALHLGLALLFLIAVWAFVSLQAGALEHSTFVIAAGVIGGYMAINIGANDVANNVGPAVGSRALTMAGALVIAAVFETAGAILAGGDVVNTISKGIIDPTLMPDTTTFIMAMTGALLAAALWLNLATYFGAPVSTTHSIVGGVLGAGIAATGTAAVNWGTMGKIAASWVISPLLGGVVAALFLAFINFAILDKDDKIAAAKRWVPVLVAIMASAFSMYLATKGLKRIWTAPASLVAGGGVVVFVATYLLVRASVARRCLTLENRRTDVNSLFIIPLIFSAALLSFAHGANDVANAIAPLAAIVDTASSGGIAGRVEIPMWVMVVGALGIATGLMLFGPRLIRIVGEKITNLNPVRAYCVALSAAITVLIASAMGLPVSSTHIALGGVFGVGFFREFLANYRRGNSLPQSVGAAATPGYEKPRKRKLVRRAHLATIATAWLVTVPMAALLAALLFFLLDAIRQA